MYRLLDRQTVYEIVANLFLNKRFLNKNTFWDKSNFFNTIGTFGGHCLSVFDGKLTDVRFSHYRPRMFSTNVVTVKRICKKKNSTWLYVQDKTLVQNMQHILNDFAKNKTTRYKTTYFNFEQHQVVLQDMNNIVKECVEDDSETELEMECHFYLGSHNNFIVPVLKEITYIKQ